MCVVSEEECDRKVVVQWFLVVGGLVGDENGVRCVHR